MPKTIDLPELQDTGGIELDTGQMTAIAIKAIRAEAEKRKPSIVIHGRVVVAMRERIRPLLHEQMLARAELWKEHYDATVNKQ